MTPKRKARMAARLAACRGEITQRRARELIYFWFDSEAVSTDIPVDQLAEQVRAYAASASPSTGAP